MSDKEITSHIEHDGLSGAELQTEKTTNTISTNVEEDENYRFGVPQALAFFVSLVQFLHNLYDPSATDFPCLESLSDGF